MLQPWLRGCNFCGASNHHREIFSETAKIKPNFDCKYDFPIDLAPNGSPFGAQTYRKRVFTIQICNDFSRDSEKISLRA